MHRVYDQPPNGLLVLAALLTLGCKDSSPSGTLTTGSVAVSVTTTGSVKSADKDGYVVRVDGGQGLTLGLNAATIFFNLPAGPHVVTLEGLAPNCSAAGNPRSVEVVAGEGPIGRASVAFVVSCAATGGTVQVSSSTSGTATDPNGYGVVLRGVSSSGSEYGSVSANGTVTLSEVPAGRYTVLLYGIAANCDPAAANPSEITVTEGATTPLALAVACETPGQIAFVRGFASTAEIYVVTSDGNSATALTANTTEDVDPAWSPDGGKLAFASRRDGNLEIYVMNANGTNPVRLTNSASSDYGPAWSPDGTRIAFVSDRDGNPELYAMNADGTGLVRLTTSAGIDEDPAWSPGGTTIAFRRDIGSAKGIFLMDANGANDRQITTSANGDRWPSWSPDGSRIVFARQYAGRSRDIVVMNADGSGAFTVAEWYDEAAHPTWAPNGRKIAFSADSYYYSVEIVVVGLNGVRYEGVTTLEPASNPAWRP